MSEVLFYHLERGSLESALPGLLEKTLERGWKAVVRGITRARVESLDAHLWTYRDDSFLPHAAGGDAETAARQPIWLTDGTDRPNGAEVLFLVDGAKAGPEEIARYLRCVTIFNGAEEEAVAAARASWKALAAAGCAATYWKQSADGGWERQR
jgi:DNA polymerase-3 subunit chi